MKALKLPQFNEDKADLDAYWTRLERACVVFEVRSEYRSTQLSGQSTWRISAFNRRRSWWLWSASSSSPLSSFISLSLLAYHSPIPQLLSHTDCWYSTRLPLRISGLFFASHTHWFLVFTCVSYAEARNSYRLDVRPSVRHTLSCFLHHTIAHSF